MIDEWTLKRLLPEYDRRTRYSRLVAAPPERVWWAAMTVTAAELTALKPLSALRHGTSPQLSGSLVDGAVPIPLLSTVEGHEVVFGTSASSGGCARPSGGGDDRSCRVP